MKIDLISQYAEDDIAPLYCQYFQEVNPQPAYIELDLQSHSVTAGYSSAIGSSCSADVFHGRTLCVSINPSVTRSTLERLQEDEGFVALCERVFAGSDIELDRNFNEVGVLTDDAESALEKLERFVEDYCDYEDLAIVGYCSDHFPYDTYNTLVKDGESLKDAARRLKQELASENRVAVDDILDFLEELREAKDD